MKCFSYYHLLWISNKVATPLAEFPLRSMEPGFHPWKSYSAGGALRQSVHPFSLLWAVVSLLTVFHNTGTKGLFNENEGGRDLKQMRVNTCHTIMSTPGFLSSVDVKVLYKSGQYQYLCLAEMKKDNTTCSRSPSRQCQSQSGKYPATLCSGFWLKSNYFYAAELIAPGQHDTKDSVAWTVYVENKLMALRRCKKEFRSDSSSCFCTDLSHAREQETLWLHDMFLFNDNAEYRAGIWQSGFSWKPCWLSQILGGPCRKGAVILESTLSKVSKCGVGCHQRYSHIRVKNDPVFLELFRNGQWTEA